MTQTNDNTPLTANEKTFMGRFENMFDDNGPHELTDPADLEVMRKVNGEWAHLIDPIVKEVADSLDAIDRLNAEEAAEQK